jgi:2-iminoacetate synthase
MNTFEKYLEKPRYNFSTLTELLTKYSREIDKKTPDFFNLEYSNLENDEKICRKIEDVLDRIDKNIDRPDSFIINESDFIFLLRPEAEKFLEKMAVLSRRLTQVRFGNTIRIYAPLYLSNECSSRCSYCSFSIENKIKRHTLDEKQIIMEAESLADSGILQVLAVTGDNVKKTSIPYLEKSVEILRKTFASVSVEIYPLDTSDYSRLISRGAEGLVIYQETYNQKTYKEVHRGGKKRDFKWRLEAPERGGTAGFKRIGIGILLGLSEFRPDVFLAGIHARLLMKKYWKSSISVSLPRIRPAIQSFKNKFHISETNLAQMYFALRLFLPDSFLVLSTRESPHFRDNMAGLGVNYMSAGSKTEPGGYTNSGALTQFSTADERHPLEFANALKKKGLAPVWKDWDSVII